MPGQVAIVINLMDAKDEGAVIAAVEAKLQKLSTKERLGWTWFMGSDNVPS